MPSLQTGVTFTAGDSMYTAGGEAGVAHSYLTDTKLWTIEDLGGYVDSEPPSWVEPLDNQTITVGNAFIYDVNATDNIAGHISTLNFITPV